MLFCERATRASRSGVRMNRPEGGALKRLRARYAHAKLLARYAARPWKTAARLFWLLEERSRFKEGWAPGHFYSPVPSLDDVRRREAEIFAIPREVPGVDLNEPGQLALVRALAERYPSIPHVSGRRPVRYTADNPNFALADAITLYAMILHLRPKRI